MFRGLGLFVGGCTLTSAEGWPSADLDTLESLLDKSLLRRTGERYWMLETIREYAFDRLREAGEDDGSWPPPRRVLSRPRRADGADAARERKDR